MNYTILYKNKKFDFNKIITLEEFFNQNSDIKNLVMGGYIDNRIYPLDHQISEDCSVEELLFATSPGRDIYRRSTGYILTKAVRDIF
ncbi:MAG: hypothetical protein KAS39_00835, partial [Actinomycetia bacterium]|nr:hypothetical protein [Actinomycetes bacterium]